MSKLLSAGFARLWKNVLFWIGVAGMMSLLAAVMIADYQSMTYYGAHYTLDILFTGSFMFIGFYTSIFAAMFLGTEYSNGTVRNKLIAGHSRVTIYLSNLTVCFVSSLLVCLGALLLTCIMGIPLFGLLVEPLENTLAVIGIGIFLTASYSAIFTLASMLITNKPISVAVCILSMFSMWCISMSIQEMLKEPEIHPGYAWLENGVPVSSLPYPNPRYLHGTMRAVCEFIRDFLPTGQGIQLGSGEVIHPELLPLYSLLIVICTTVIGIFFFRKKDLK